MKANLPLFLSQYGQITGNGAGGALSLLHVFRRFPQSQVGCEITGADSGSVSGWPLEHFGWVLWAPTLLYECVCATSDCVIGQQEKNKL